MINLLVMKVKEKNAAPENHETEAMRKYINSGINRPTSVPNKAKIMRRAAELSTVSKE